MTLELRSKRTLTSSVVVEEVIFHVEDTGGSSVHQRRLLQAVVPSQVVAGVAPGRNRLPLKLLLLLLLLL